MNPFCTDHFTLISRLPRSEQVAFAARCALLAIRFVKQESFSSDLDDLEMMENAVQIAELTATRSVDPNALTASLKRLGHLAFTTPTPTSSLNDEAICQVAHAAYAVGLAALTGSAAQAEDALTYALEAVQTMGSRETENAIREELRRVRQASVGIRKTSAAAIASRASRELIPA
jgi:hypothetical protein